MARHLSGLRARPGARAGGRRGWSPIITVTGVGVGVPPRSSLEDTSRSNSTSQMTVAALDALMPVVYGEARPTALLANAFILSGSYWLFWLIWCEGECDSITSFTLNDAALPPGSTVTHYLGTQTQGVDSQLVSAFAAQGITGFNEHLYGVCHSVVGVPVGAITTTPRFNATIKGQKCYDPRDGTQTYATPSTWKWTDNPSLHLFNFLENKLWGPGKIVVQSTVTTCANANDATLGSAPLQEKSRLSSLVVDREAPVSSWLDTLRAAASVFIVENQGQIKLVPDADGSLVTTYDHANGNVIDVTQPVLRDPSSLPTVIEVTYTDKSSLPWKDATTDPVYRPGVQAGTTPYRKQNLQMLWVTRGSQAAREAVERMNKLWLRAVTFKLQLMDEGLMREPGDLIGVTYPDHGFSSLPSRVLTATPTDYGWELECEKHDPGAYSTTVIANPTVGYTTLPLPNAPPVPTASGAWFAEERYQANTGEWRSRMRATWDDMSAYPFLVGYRVEMYAGTALIDSTTVKDNTYASPQAQELVTYTINVYTLSPIAISPALSADAQALGKQGVPGDVPYFFVYEAAGETRFQWINAIDLDLSAHEIRYGPVASATWANSAATAMRVPFPATQYATRTVPPGNYRFFIKGLDSIVTTPGYPFGQESTNPTTYDLDLAGDPDLFIASTYAFTSVTRYQFHDGTYGNQRKWVTNFGTLATNAFTASPLSSGNYNNPLATYSGSAGASPAYVYTETFDLGQSYSGTLQATLAYTDLVVGEAVDVYLETSTDGSNWSQWVGLSANVVARFVRVRVQASGSAHAVITSLGQIQLSVVTLTETGEVTTLASGWVTVTLDRKYTHIKTIQLTADCTAGQRNPGYSHPVLATDPRYVQMTYVPEDYVDENFLPACSFDVACWDGSNNQQATPVRYLFEGI